MSGSVQGSDIRDRDPAPFGRQSSAPTPSYDSHSTPSAPPLNATSFPSRSGIDPQTRSVSTNHLSLRGRESPDPGDYYRQRGFGTADVRHSGEGDGTMGMDATGYPKMKDRVSPLPADMSGSRRPAPRSTDSPALGDLSGSSFPRSRQTSFKDLVKRFDNPSDPVLPLPSRSASRAASPAGSVDGAERPRVLSRRRNGRDSSPSSPETERLVPALLSSTAPPPLFQRIPDSQPRRPLFGELLSVNTEVNNSGHEFSSPLRRRGSEGSIPSPNSTFDQANPSSARSPLTPTAWYLGHTASLEAVQSGTQNTHRRIHSDAEDGSSYKTSLAEPWNSQMAVPAPLQTKGDGSPGTNSRSRIPVSAYRRTTASGAESPSNPTFSSRSAALSPKGHASRLPKPSPKPSPVSSPKDSPPHHMTDDAPITVRARRESANGRTGNPVSERSRLLQAYIAAPPPKKSPPLRSSRPRQSVSHGTPTSPRSKVGDRISSFQKQDDRKIEARSPRERRIPELGNVDFETRRRLIQQAFNRTVQENERKEEEAAELRRRARRDEEGEDTQPPADDRSSTPSTPVTRPPVPEKMAIPARELVSITSPLEKELPALPQLHLNTSLPVSTKDTPHTAMDSPTLGIPSAGSQQQPGVPVGTSSATDAVPSSAVTAQSNDTHVTTFDPEPQSGLLQRNPSTSNRTLLSHIMQIRGSSPESSSCDEPDCSLSENDDKESVQIMLRETTYFDSSSSTDTQEPHPAQIPQVHVADPVQNRWSMSSWSSSLRNQHSTFDDRCEESSDEIILQKSLAEPETEPAIQSCSAASTRPPSVVDDEASSTPLQDYGVTGPDTLEVPEQSERNSFSTPPSLARQGRWDSRRVTQLYLEELTRGGRGHSLPFPAVRVSPEPSVDTGSRTDGRTDSLTDDPVVVPRFQDFPVTDRLSHTASLVGRDDWEHASPSIMDWMQIAADDDAASPAADKTGRAPDGVPTPRLMTSAADLNTSYQPDTGLGLSINIQDPRELPTIPPSQSPSQFRIDDKTPTGDVPPHNGILSALGGATHSTGSSEDSSFRRLEPSQSPQAADSSATSLAPSTEQLARMQSKKSPSPEQRRLKKRRHIIKELVDTEYSFGRDMKVVDDIYKGTSSSCLDLSADDVKILFANSDLVVQFSMAFQDALKQAARSIYVMPKSQRWNSKRSTRNNRPRSSGADEQSPGDVGKSDLEKDRLTSIGLAFMNHMAQMEKVYTDYLRNHDAANKKLQVLQRNPKVAIWLKECREWAADLTSAWDLDSLLVKPVQRILKYPLLLSELLESTPNDHPDRLALSNALQEVTNISIRINEMKKRVDLVGQVVGRKRKESDVRTGLSKAFGRRTEKLRQQVGLSDMFEDKIYDALSQKFGDGYFQLQVVMRDVEMYTQETQASIDRLNEFVAAIEGVIDVTQSNYSELESKWRRFKMTIREILTAALPEHLDVVRQSVINPMVNLLKLHEGPQRVMKKRDKRLLDYARYKAVKDRGDKPDKKTTEQGEQFMALNEALKDELPRFYGLTAKLMEACLKNFVEVQTTWYGVLQKKIGTHVETFPNDLQKVISDWNSDYAFSDAQVLSLGVCNGALLADTVNLVNFNTPSTGTNVNSPRRPSTVNSSNARPGSMVDESPKNSHDFSVGSQPFQSPQVDGQSTQDRRRAESSYSGHAPPDTPELPRSQLLQQVTNTSSSTSQATKPADEAPFPRLPHLSLDTPFLADLIAGSSSDTNPPASPAGRYSGFFSSAMPMPDTPTTESDAAPTDSRPAKAPNVLFLAASIYEFNIDRARREAGYPYLTYVAGEIFDVIGEKGELWLARNQDDSTSQVGWIWNKHFAKLSS
ncbi:hypothetical protein NUU61_006908 [Penicillium alfredii]|uniref:Dynamin-binding protein n=1 Tax=Penicillium alfredii TaxID=1506179 RepID=A0A9W9K3S0_9EURO|nr:uncharacterized protein NUU61_006908 [Penicillium alfredii]KAJ5092038.1 hypothetical protein NUU61_006908 [Penicillium alfredii]